MAKRKIEHAELLRVLDYNPETGAFTWKVRLCKKYKLGAVAGSPHCKGYWIIRIHGVGYLAHRLAWFYVHAVWPPITIDHWDLNKRNNAIGNLRNATIPENHYNIPKQANNSSGFKGVYFDKREQKFIARCNVEKKTHRLGAFDTAEKASEAYVNFATVHHREFANVVRT